MPYDSTSPPVRVYDIVSRPSEPEREPGPAPAAAARPPHVPPIDDFWRPPRRRFVLRRREPRR